MADKQLSRPSGNPSWANDTNHNDPGEPWDASPTKVEPGAGLRNSGWLPNTDIEAEHVNTLLNEMGRWVQYLSDIQIQNWLGPVEAQEETVASAAARITGRAICWDDTVNRWFIFGDLHSASPDKFLWAESPDGVALEYASFTEAGAGYAKAAFSKSKDVGSAHTGEFVVVIASTSSVILVGDVVKVNKNGTWSESTLSGTAAQGWEGLAFDAGDKLLVGGQSGAPFAVTVWHSDPGTISWTAVTLTPTLSEAVSFGGMATDGSTVLVCGLYAASNPLCTSWTSTNGTTWTERPLSSDIEGIRAVAYQAGVWMLVDDTGQVFTSSDAISWTLRATLTAAVSVGLVSRLIAEGGYWILTDSDRIYVSSDDGVSWRIIYPGLLESDENNSLQAAWSPQQQRFALLQNVDPPDGSQERAALLRSLSLGTVLQDAVTNADSTPTVP